MTSSVTAWDEPGFAHRIEEETTVDQPTAIRRHTKSARQPEWDAYAAVCDATAGALQALAVIAGFVVFGLGWAMLAAR